MFTIMFRYGWVPWLVAAFVVLIFFRKKSRAPLYVKLLLGLSAAWFVLAIVVLAAARPRTLLSADTADASSSKLSAYVLERGRRAYLLIERPASGEAMQLYLGGNPFGRTSYTAPKALLWSDDASTLAVVFDTERVLVLPMPENGFPDKEFLNTHARFASGEELERLLARAGL
jgi:hypothetical protein